MDSRYDEASSDMQTIWDSTFYHELCGEQRRPPDIVATMVARADDLLRESKERPDERRDVLEGLV